MKREQTTTQHLTYGRALTLLKGLGVPAQTVDFVERFADMMSPVKVEHTDTYKVKTITFTNRHGDEVVLTDE